jgi:hypothetical protein
MLLYGGAILLGKFNVPPSKSINDFLEYFYAVVPLAALLIFSLWYFPSVERNWLLLRVWIAGMVGAHFVLEKGLSAHSEQGPGIGTAYLVGLILTFWALVIGSIFVKFRF